MRLDNDPQAKINFDHAKDIETEKKKIGRNTILYWRDLETGLSTTGAFTITGTTIQGFFLEPPGPSTKHRNRNKRIPAGSYHLILNYGKKHGLRLYNVQVPQSRAVLIHVGNFPKDTRGCLLPGRTRALNIVRDSKSLLHEIMLWFKGIGPNEASIVIHDPILPPRGRRSIKV
jgi:hypothetical protein